MRPALHGRAPGELPFGGPSVQIKGRGRLCAASGTWEHACMHLAGVDSSANHAATGAGSACRSYNFDFANLYYVGGILTAPPINSASCGDLHRSLFTLSTKKNTGPGMDGCLSFKFACPYLCLSSTCAVVFVHIFNSKFVLLFYFIFAQ